MLLSIQVKRFVIKLIKHDSKKVKLFVVLVLLTSVSFYSWLLYSIFRNRMKDDNFIGLYKCPACYGTSLCSEIKQGNVLLDGWSKVGPLDFINVKNVHFGTLNGERVVVKKLGRKKELKNLDEQICFRAGDGINCDVREAILKLPLVTAVKVKPSLVAGMSDLFTCPSERLLNLVLEKYLEDPVTERRVSHPRAGDVARMYLATTLAINPEPLIMQIFPAEQGWPFPRYDGACGRLVVTSYVGPTLLTAYDAPWQKRMDYAYQVMKIAELFTEHKSGFALYWTDLSYDNMAISKDDKVIVVDLENIIVVDKTKIKREKRAGWDEPYLSQFDECPREDGSCVSFSVDSLCAHYTADFNYYTACRNLLSHHASDPRWQGGLLHDLPPAVESKLRPLLNECAKPTVVNGRLKVKDELIKTLQNARQNVS